MDEVNKIHKTDVVYAIAKAGLGSLPFVGTAASELLSLIITPPLEKRRNKWMLEIGEKLKELEEDGITLDSLQENEQFIDVVMQATALALKTSEQEKLNAFKNIITNTAVGNKPDKTMTQIFLNYVDSFTTWHIVLLHLFHDPISYLTTKNIPHPNITIGSLRIMIRSVFSNNELYDDLLNIVWSDLTSKGLIDTGGLDVTMTIDGILSSRTTPTGKDFLTFISDNGSQ